MTGLELLRATINSLNQVEVKGEENLDPLLASIKALKTLEAMYEKTEEAVDNGDSI